MFSIVGRKPDADDIAESFLIGAEELEPARLDFTIAAARMIRATERIHCLKLRVDDLRDGRVASRNRIRRWL